MLKFLTAATAAMLLNGAAAETAAQNNGTEVKPSSWAAVDGLGRFMPECDNVGVPRRDKFVGIFFWTWHSVYAGADNAVNKAWASLGRGIGTLNVQKIMEENPEAKNDYNHPAWRKICRDGKLGSGHWNEPVWGYYFPEDEWVLRRQGILLADAGVDAVIFDNTNGVDTWEKGYMALGKVFSKMKSEGINVPKISFMLPIGDYWRTDNAESNRLQLRELWEKVYSKGLFKDIWFYWKGKPLIMAFPDALNPKDPIDKRILEFFTFRPCQASYFDGQTENKKWGWLSVYPQKVYRNPDGTPEQITVGVAQNTNQESACKKVTTSIGKKYTGSANVMNGEEIFGRSYTSKGFDPRPNSKLYGANFQEQWDYALKVDPEFIFVTGWNELISAPKPVRIVPNGFSDQFDDEHSRDVEPSKGDLKDHYYYQLCANIRKFKGAESPPAPAEKSVLNLDSSPEDWAKKAAAYCDYKKDLSPRDAQGYYHYKSDTGRNALEIARVSHDGEFIYFEAVSPKKLSPQSDKNWMRLLIRTNRLGETWEGFQFILNRFSPQDKAYLEKCRGEWSWNLVEKCEYRIDGNRLIVKIPRKALKADTPKFELRFKWCDNNLSDGDILSLYTDGDTMPGGRFTFVYRADDMSEKTAEPAGEVNSVKR